MFHSALLAQEPHIVELSRSIIQPKGIPRSNKSSSKQSVVRFELAQSRQMSSDSEDKFSLQEIKTRVKAQAIKYLKTVGKTTSCQEDTYIVLSLIEEAKNFTQIFEYLINLVRTATVAERQQLERGRREREGREARAAVREGGRGGGKPEAGGTMANRSLQRIEQLEVKMEQLKKELFRTRQTKSAYERKLVTLASEFKQRRLFYQAEIKKLTDIISLSSVDVRKLVLEKTKQAKILEERQQKHKLEPLPSTTTLIQEPKELIPSRLPREINQTHKKTNASRISALKDPEVRKYKLGTIYSQKQLSSIVTSADDYNIELRDYHNAGLRNLEENFKDLLSL